MFISKRSLGRGRYQRNLEQSSPPFTMQIEVSTACHLACVMCSRKEKTGGPSEHMSEEAWQNFFAVASQCDGVNILGTGEPWTHPQFLNYLRQLDAAGVPVELITAGDLINSERAQVLGEMRHLREITFSIDSPDPETYQRIRGQPLSRALAGLRRTTDAVGPSVVVRIAAVVMRDNLSSLAKFPALLREYAVPRLSLRGVNQTSQKTATMMPDYNATECALLLGICDEAETFGATVDLLPTIPPEIIRVRGTQFAEEKGADLKADLVHQPASTDTPPTRICFDPWEKAVVVRNGDVYPCECYHLQQSVGSIVSKSFEEVWASEAYRTFRKTLLLGENPGCLKCERRAWGVHPLNQYAAELVSCTLNAGGEGEVRLRNIGTLAWSKDKPVRLATARPRDRQDSVFEHASWIGPNRLATHTELNVQPGEIATFCFFVAEVSPEAPIEYFQFVVEGVCWLPDTRLEFSHAGAVALASRRPSRPPSALKPLAEQILGSWKSKRNSKSPVSH
jgi:radical SAM protein with 4Fe4S-binding SPASM domain